jgi:hypothetical protein
MSIVMLSKKILLYKKERERNSRAKNEFNESTKNIFCYACRNFVVSFPD